MAKPDDNHLPLDYPPLYCETCQKRILDKHGCCRYCSDAECTEHLSPREKQQQQYARNGSISARASSRQKPSGAL